MKTILLPKTGAMVLLLSLLSTGVLAQDTAWQLVWSDEFNSKALDTGFWNSDTGIGDHGWGNDELQYYTMGRNISFKDSCLVIELAKEDFHSMGYTSARINTRKKVAFQYGKIQARIRPPYSQAVWPAFWTLGTDFDRAGWPACGEVDIFEMACGVNWADNRGDNTNFAVVHYSDYADNLAEQKKGISIDRSMSDTFHVFTLIWDEKFLSFYFDTAKAPYFQVDISKAYMTEFHQPHSLTLNMAMGGRGFAGLPDATTVTPQYLYVDWIRWYQRKVPIGHPIRPAVRPEPAIRTVAGGMAFSLISPDKSFLVFYNVKGQMVADASPLLRSMKSGSNTISWERLAIRSGAFVLHFSDGAGVYAVKAFRHPCP
jgi:beta-glucanase (GH16 family)